MGHPEQWRVALLLRNKKNMKTFFTLLWLVLTSHLSVVAQTVTVPFEAGRWTSENADFAFETFMEKPSVLLKSGFIYAKDVELQDGIIEFDINFPQQRGFPGVVFRVADPMNAENFYMRPHQSGNPDATQYTPVFNGEAGWQLYHGEGYSKAFPFKFNTWQHVRIDVHGLQAEIYIDDMQSPLIRVTELKQDPRPGKIGLVSGGLPVHFADFRYTPKTPALFSRQPIPENGKDGLITRWQVGNGGSRKMFEKRSVIPPDMEKKLKWSTQSTEPSGTINLSKHMQAADSGKTIVARIVIQSANDQLKPLSFGFSDYVTIFLNDRALFSGRDNFMSRDYRFLGTIGYFDTVFLPLKKGDNELWFVVWEDFGGCGVKAKFEDMTGITLK